MKRKVAPCPGELSTQSASAVQLDEPSGEWKPEPTAFRSHATVPLRPCWNTSKIDFALVLCDTRPRVGDRDLDDAVPNRALMWT